jgi:hypothetical protein
MRPALVLLAAALACATTRSEHAARCPEAKNLSCLTAEKCSLDEARGCFACVCSAARATPSAGAGVARPDAPTLPPPPTP